MFVFFSEAGVSDIFDLINLEDADRDALLTGLPQTQIQEIAVACNRYPVINVDFDISNAVKKEEPPKADEESKAGPLFVLSAGKPATLLVNLERVADSEDLGPVVAPFFPKQKDEQWWLVVGNPTSNALLAIKRITVNK